MEIKISKINKSTLHPPNCHTAVSRKVCPTEAKNAPVPKGVMGSGSSPQCLIEVHVEQFMVFPRDGRIIKPSIYSYFKELCRI